MHDLLNKYSLPDTPENDKFMLQKLITFSEIDIKFYETPAMLDPSWKDRQTFIHEICLSWFPSLTMQNKSYHWCAKYNCECEKW